MEPLGSQCNTESILETSLVVDFVDDVLRIFNRVFSLIFDTFDFLIDFLDIFDYFLCRTFFSSQLIRKSMLVAAAERTAIVLGAVVFCIIRYCLHKI